MGDEKLVLVSEAAQQTGYSAEWLRRLIDAGKVKGKKVGRYYLVLESEIPRLQREPRSRRGRPRKQPPATETSDYRYPDPSEHRATGRILKAAESRPTP